MPDMTATLNTPSASLGQSAKALLRLIHEASSRGAFASPSPNAKNSVPSVFGHEQGYPKVDRGAATQLLRDAHAAGLLAVEDYKSKDRKPRQRWRLTSAGLALIYAVDGGPASAPSAPCSEHGADRGANAAKARYRKPPPVQSDCTQVGAQPVVSDTTPPAPAAPASDQQVPDAEQGDALDAAVQKFAAEAGVDGEQAPAVGLNPTADTAPAPACLAAFGYEVPDDGLVHGLLAFGPIGPEVPEADGHQ